MHWYSIRQVLLKGSPCNTEKVQNKVSESITLMKVLRFSAADGVGGRLCGRIKPKYLAILIGKHRQIGSGN